MGVNAQVVSASTRDPAEFELVLRPWELHCLPQSGGTFEHSITSIGSPLFRIYREKYNLPVHIQGLSPDGMLAFCIPLDFQAQPYFWGNRLADVEIPSTLPGPLDVNFRGPQVHLVALVMVDYLEQVLPQESVSRLRAAAHQRRFQLPAGASSKFAWWGCRLMDAAESQPSRFKQAAVAEAVLHEIVDFLNLVADNQLPPRPIAHLAARRRGLSRALEFLRYRLESRVSIGELCREAGVSERSLQTAFREEFGVSPTEFMRRRRLHAARQKLIMSHRSETTVSQVAIECGFLEFGRFAVEYRRLFGMTPSATLARELPDPGIAEQLAPTI